MRSVHIARLQTCIEVELVPFQYQNPLKERLLLTPADIETAALSLNLRGLVAHIDRVVREARRWVVIGRVSRPILLALPDRFFEWEAPIACIYVLFKLMRISPVSISGLHPSLPTLNEDVYGWRQCVLYGSGCVSH